jgi:hypothetical protein
MLLLFRLFDIHHQALVISFRAQRPQHHMAVCDEILGKSRAQPSPQSIQVLEKAHKELCDEGKKKRGGK